MRIQNLSIVSFLMVMSILLVGCNRTNWRENFREKSKSPFGAYIIFEESNNLFDPAKVLNLEQNIYDYFNWTYFEEDYKFNYICIKNNANKITQDGIDLILDYVKDGSHAFFSLNDFSTELETALQIKTTNLDIRSYSPSHLKKLKGELKLNNPDFHQQSFQYDRNLRRNYFSSYNPSNTIVLGTQNIEGKEEPTFLKIYHGKGAVYVHTQPIVFTNYNMLNENHTYVENVLSYLPDEDVLWDPQIRWSKINDSENSDSDSNAGSVFVFFWNNPSLKWFLYLGFFGLLLFMLFNARRKQRAIPVIEPPKNSTLEFTHTISNLYLKNESHKNVIEKKILFFLEKVRTRYLIDTHNLNKEFIEKLAMKSGNELSKTKYLINSIIALNKKEMCTEEDVMTLNKMIDNFLKQK